MDPAIRRALMLNAPSMTSWAGDRRQQRQGQRVQLFVRDHRRPRTGRPHLGRAVLEPIYSPCALRSLGLLPEPTFRIPGRDSLLAFSEDHIGGAGDIHREEMIRRFFGCPIDPGPDRVVKCRAERWSPYINRCAVELHIAVGSLSVAGDTVDD